MICTRVLTPQPRFSLDEPAQQEGCAVSSGMSESEHTLLQHPPRMQSMQENWEAGNDLSTAKLAGDASSW